MTPAESEALYKRAVAIYNREGRISTKLVQDELKVGYGRAEALVKQVREAAITSLG